MDLPINKYHPHPVATRSAAKRFQAGFTDVDTLQQETWLTHCGAELAYEDLD